MAVFDNVSMHLMVLGTPWRMLSMRSSVAAYGVSQCT